MPKGVKSPIKFGTKRDDGKIWAFGMWTNSYTTWVAMRHRCRNPNLPAYEQYGGRGISVCTEWNKSFRAFHEDMGERPTMDHSIERIDVNGNYGPENCVWATDKEQAWNKTNTIYVEWAGERISLPRLVAERGWDWNKAYANWIAGRPLDDFASYSSKHLNESDVHDIVCLLPILDNAEISRAFGVTRQMIDLIRSGKRWAKVSGISPT